MNHPLMTISETTHQHARELGLVIDFKKTDSIIGQLILVLLKKENNDLALVTYRQNHDGTLIFYDQDGMDDGSRDYDIPAWIPNNTDLRKLLRYIADHVLPLYGRI